jgi:hypothetical protein
MRENCTHADHVEGVHPDVGDDLDDLVLRHELHLRVSKANSHLLHGCVQGAMGGRRSWEVVGSGTSEGEKMERCRSDCPAMAAAAHGSAGRQPSSGGDLVEGATTL